MEETQAIDAVGHPKEISTMVVETGDPLEQAILARCLPPAISQVSPSQLAPSGLSVMENLKTTMEFLKSFFLPGEK